MRPDGPVRQNAALLYAEDLTVGRCFELGAWTFTAEAIKEFAATWDPLPFHIDAAAGGASEFGGLVASGLHSMAVAVRLVADALVSCSAVIAGREVRSLRLRKPVRPGTTLTGSVVVTDQRLRNDGRGLIVFRTELVDDEGDIVLTLLTEGVFRRRDG